MYESQEIVPAAIILDHDIESYNHKNGHLQPSAILIFIYTSVTRNYKTDFT